MMGIKAYFQNIKGLRSKLYELMLLLKTYQPDVVALQDTWLNDKIEVQSEGYKMYKPQSTN